MKAFRLASTIASGAMLFTVGMGSPALAADTNNVNNHQRDFGRFDNNNFNNVLHARRPSLEQFLRQVDPDDFRWNGNHWVRVRSDRDDQRFIRLYFRIFGDNRREHWDGRGWDWNGNHWDTNGNWNGHNNHNNERDNERDD